MAVFMCIHFFLLKHIFLVLKLNKTQSYWLTHSCLYGVDMTSDMRYWNKWFTRELLSFFPPSLSLSSAKLLNAKHLHDETAWAQQRRALKIQ